MTRAGQTGDDETDGRADDADHDETEALDLEDPLDGPDREGCRRSPAAGAAGPTAAPGVASATQLGDPVADAPAAAADRRRQPRSAP